MAFDGDLPPVRCAEGEDAVYLSGTADRVDGYIKGGRLYVRVMDYKSGYKSFSLSDVWNGLNLQLIIYLFAIEREGLERYRHKLAADLDGIEAAGVLYIPARDEVMDLDADEPDEDKLRALKGQGVAPQRAGQRRFNALGSHGARPCRREPVPAGQAQSGQAHQKESRPGADAVGHVGRGRSGPVWPSGRGLRRAS